MPTYVGDFQCPVCGEEVKAGAAACPECGACEKTGLNAGYSGGSFHDGLELPDDDFDYEEFLKKEIEGKHQKSKKEWLIAVIALAVIMVWALAYVF